MNYERHPVIFKEATTLLGLQVVTIWQQSNAKVQRHFWLRGVAACKREQETKR